ncbi:hypothetical protein N9V23_01565, partial [Flavobacteriales bacterium]|nr:hypothetical protein [Flavobacteriales bacterium]
MTVYLNASQLDDYEGDFIGAFYDLNNDDILDCIGLEIITAGFHGLAIWGDDSTTPEKDGLDAGEIPIFAILHNEKVIELHESPDFTGYITNFIFLIEDVEFTDENDPPIPEVIGCMNPLACNFNPQANIDDSKCIYANEVCEHCINGEIVLLDFDMDGHCDIDVISNEMFDNELTSKYAPMSFLISSPKFSDFSGGVFGIFYDLNKDGELESVGEGWSITDNFVDGVVYGDNPYTVGVEGLVGGEIPLFAILHNGEITYIKPIQDFPGYSPYSIISLTDFYVYEFEGCTHVNATNFNPDAKKDDCSCIFAELNKDCNGDCLNDVDADGVCDEEGEFGCNLPAPYAQGSTGNGMTVFLGPDVISSLPITTQETYLVALSQDGLVVGGGYVSGVTLTAISVWGDDSASDSPEIDGALANESIDFLLVDGTALYEVVMPTPVTYSSNGIVVQESSANVSAIDCSDDDETILGCTEPTATNYNSQATQDDGYCEYEVYGCTDVSAYNYNADATLDDGSCVNYVFGCTDPDADNYDPNATLDDGSCETYDDEEEECPVLDFSFVNTGANMTILFIESFVSNSGIEPGTSVGVFTTDEYGENPVCYGSVIWTGNVVSMAAMGDDTNTDELDGFAEGDTVYVGCQLSDGIVMGLSSDYIYTTNGIKIIDSGVFEPVCDEYSEDSSGCTDSQALNFDSDATEDDGSCQYSGYAGCTDPAYTEFNVNATNDDGSCSTPVIYGCIDYSYLEYNSAANTDNGTCFIPVVYGCTDASYVEFDFNANT